MKFVVATAVMIAFRDDVGLEIADMWQGDDFEDGHGILLATRTIGCGAFDACPKLGAGLGREIV